MTAAAAPVPMPGATADPFAAALRTAVRNVDSLGRLRREDARALRRGIRFRASRAALLADPESVLGAWEDLPAGARAALASVVIRDSRWRMAGYSLGRWHEASSRALWRLQNRLSPGSRRAAAEIVASAVQAGPFFAVPAARRLFQSGRARFGPRPTLGDFLAAAGVETRSLAVRYVPGLPQQTRYRGFWHDSASHSTVGLLVGLDLIEDDQGFWLVESNMNCGLEIIRTVIFRRDPLVRGLLDVTAAGGYRRLVVVSGATSVDEEMTRQYREGAAERRLELLLFEDSFKTLFGHPGTAGLPELGRPDTLLVRNRHYRTPLDWTIHHKRASSRALRLYKEETGDASFRLPTTSFEPVFAPPDPADPFPNLVFKMPESDNGEDVVFLKVTSPEHARELLARSLSRQGRRGALGRLYSRLLDRDGLFQTFIPTRLTADRRLYKTRAYVLLTPIGVHFLAAHRLIGCAPVPESLPVGLVEDQAPYLVNWRPGSRLEKIPPGDLPAVSKAALGVARGLAHSLDFAFESGLERPMDGARRPVEREWAAKEPSGGR